MDMELRWFKSVDDCDYKLQYRLLFNPNLPDSLENKGTDWRDVLYVLEGAEGLQFPGEV
ncbi:MAG: hypothetical protein M1510_00980 [Nitrospirae bacterium]|nr:hypothetical protein [Nitrospirota bacterium]MCL5238655.1 hypothetical protein [Nitrospirota bacterium]